MSPPPTPRLKSFQSSPRDTDSFCGIHNVSPNLLPRLSPRDTTPCPLPTLGPVPPRVCLPLPFIALSPPPTISCLPVDGPPLPWDVSLIPWPPLSQVLCLPHCALTLLLALLGSLSRADLHPGLTSASSLIPPSLISHVRPKTPQGERLSIILRAALPTPRTPPRHREEGVARCLWHWM